eukprot:6209602-Pleurochrysis_carterae.AAC.1
MIGESNFGSRACSSVLRHEATPTGVAFGEARDIASSSEPTTPSLGTGAGRGGVMAHACCASISTASVR